MSDHEELGLLEGSRLEEPDAKDGGAMSRLLSHASAARKWLFALFVVCQGAFVLCFFFKADVFQLSPGVVAGAAVSLALLIAVGAVLVGTAPEGRLVLLCVLVCAFVWMLLFAAWMQLFIASAVLEVLELPDSGVQERVLSGFVVLLVFSSDVFSALDHLNEARPSWRAMLPVLLIAAALVGVTATQRFFASAESLPFEIALTALIVLLHLQASVVAHHGPAVGGLAVAVGVSLVSLAGLCAAVCLFVLEHEPVADVLHRCVDVLLLLESHVARVALLRR